MIVHVVMLATAIAPALGDEFARPNKTSGVAVASKSTNSEKPVCRRYADVGSNIARRKICMTKQQWDKMARDSQEIGRNMQPALTTGAQ